jgi:hypothetical protein
MIRVVTIFFIVLALALPLGFGSDACAYSLGGSSGSRALGGMAGMAGSPPSGGTNFVTVYRTVTVVVEHWTTVPAKQPVLDPLSGRIRIGPLWVQAALFVLALLAWRATRRKPAPPAQEA